MLTAAAADRYFSTIIRAVDLVMDAITANGILQNDLTIGPVLNRIPGVKAECSANNLELITYIFGDLVTI